MDGEIAVEVIKTKFRETGLPVKIPLQKGGQFTAKLVDAGLEVDNLGTQPLLPWVVFEEAINLLVRKGGRAARGDAMAYRLGDQRLPLDSIEGHVAYVVYRKEIGDSVFRRISPIAAVLVWAGLCDWATGGLILRSTRQKTE